jgi:simple sugar transport system ATP-binding protein/ribose transport system ATP-binding protein
VSSKPHVELRALGKRFDGVQALKRVTLAIQRGEVHGLVGENGAGKSTLGKVLAGALQPDEGVLLVAGREVSYRSPRQALEDGLTLIAQEQQLVQTRSVIENVFLGVEPAWHSVVNRRRVRARYAALSERTGFALSAQAPVYGLRASDKQKVEVMRALAREADVIVMDEPTAGLTRDESAQLLAIVRRLRSQGTTVVYISHTLEEVLAIADTVSILRDGELVRSAPAAQESVGSLVTAMLGRPLAETYPVKAFPPADAPAVLSLVGLSRGGFVDNVSFEIRAGEIVGLAGLVGSGRTQVARLVFGAERLDGGSMSIDGQLIRVRSPRDAIRHGIALLPESREHEGLMMGRSLVENVALPHLEAVSRGGVLRRAYESRCTAEAIKKVGVRTHSLTATPATLSGGNQQKLLFAKWLHRRPRVLIADEPTRGIDVGARHALYELIHASAATGMGVLVISSEVREVLGLAHRIIVMRQGRVVEEVDGRSGTEDEVMRAAFGNPQRIGSTE